MRCPYCGYVDSKVTDSREADDGIRRRRECLSPSCGRRFTTYERVQIAPLTVVKRDGRREEFSREKVLAGIRRSCDKLPVSANAIAAIVDDIETALHARGAAEVPSSDIGDMVMERLRELNDVAYVRFAAHYRRFQEIDEFQQELARARTAPRRPARRVGAAQPPLLPATELTRVEQPGSRAVGQEAGKRKQEAGEPSDTPRIGDRGAGSAEPTHIEERRRRAGGQR
jgi:transcriptional repressor NrdR